MAMSAQDVAELALIDLAFAQAEIRASKIASPELHRALRHIESASENLKILAPDFDDPSPPDGA
jgi:hypothetical protein